MSSASTLEIALALVWRDGCLLITRRPADTHLGGLWEFPGGKCLPGESPEASAEREALEEVGVACRARERLEPIVHEYPERTVRLHPVICDYQGGPPRPLQVTEWAWVRPEDLPRYPFPPANAGLIRYLMSEAPPECGIVPPSTGLLLRSPRSTARMKRFEGKVALITGGAAGIGFATAQRLGREGARVAILDHSAPDVELARSVLEADEIECSVQEGDVSRREEVQAWIQGVLTDWQRADVLVANAGARHFGSLLDATDADWERVLSVNLKGTGDTCVTAAKAMRAVGEGGAIVVVSSVHSFVGRADMPIYDATKAGLLSLTRSLAVDLAPDIRVNSVCPGFTVTDFHLRRAEGQGRTREDLQTVPVGLLMRPARPAEVAAAIAFLASEDASYITGTNLMVDGGRHAI